MAQAERMPGFVERHRVNIQIAARVPVLISIQMHIARDRFRVHRHRVKGVGKRAAGAIKGIAVAMGTAGKSDVDGVFAGCTLPRLENDVGVFRPFVQGSQHFSLGQRGRHANGQRTENIAEMGGIIGAEVPAVDQVRVLTHSACKRQHPGAGVQLVFLYRGVFGLPQRGFGRKNVGHLVVRSQAQQLLPRGENQRVCAQQYCRPQQQQTVTRGKLLLHCDRNVGVKFHQDVEPGRQGVQLRAQLVLSFETARPADTGNIGAETAHHDRIVRQGSGDFATRGYHARQILHSRRMVELDDAVSGRVGGTCRPPGHARFQV